jgi:adhesin transport system outer membrane protein
MAYQKGLAMIKTALKTSVLTLACATVIGAPLQGFAQSKPTEMSLSQAVSVGVMTNPEYGRVAASRRATDEELNQAKALYLPSVDLRADGGVEYTDNPSTRAGLDNDDSETFGRYDSQLTLTQMLFDGWNTKYENERQKNRVQSSAYRVHETSELTGLAIVEAFLEVMRQRELLTITRENVAEHQAIMQMIEEGVNAGRSTAADLEQIKARLASARAQEATVRQQLRDAESDFQREVGDAPKDLVMPAVPVNAISADVEAEVKQAMANSPTLAVRQSDIEVAYNEYQGTGSTLYPELDLQLGARQGHNIGGVEGRDRSASALVVMNWNLYRGGGDIARIREFKHRHQQSKEERAVAARDIERDIRQTWASMVSAGERAKEFSSQAAANSEVVRAYKDQFNLDRRTLLDVLDSQNELFVSRSNTINAEFLEIFSVFRLLALKGQLLPTLGVQVPREAALIEVNNPPAEK